MTREEIPIEALTEREENHYQSISTEDNTLVFEMIEELKR